MIKVLDGLGHGLHVLAMLRAELLEVGTRALDDDILVARHYLEVLDIDFILDQTRDGLEHRTHVGIESGHHKGAQRLTHLDVDFASEGK